MEPIRRNAHTVLQKLFTDKTNSDVVFKIRTEDETTVDFQAHKLVMASTSEVFQAMFFGPVAEKNKEIFVKDVDVTVFQHLLEYAYGIDVQFRSLDDAIGTAFGSKRYLMDDLHNCCLQRLYEHTEFDRAFTVFEVSLLLEAKKLKHKCVNLIIDNFDIINKCVSLETDASNSFFILNSGHMKLLLNAISSELNPLWLFNFAHRWCQKQLDQISGESLSIRHFFEPFLPHIRFLMMSYEDYVTQVLPSNVLAPEVETAIGVNIGCKGKLRCPLPIWCNPTCIIDYFFSVKNNTVKCFHLKIINGSEGLQVPIFSVSHDSYLCRIKFEAYCNEEESTYTLFTARLSENSQLKEEFTIRSDEARRPSTAQNYNALQEKIRPSKLTEIEICPTRDVLLKRSNKYGLNIKFESNFKTHWRFTNYFPPNSVYEFPMANHNKFLVAFEEAINSTYIELQFRVPFDGIGS